jgi:DNA-binding transcriptional LysR family regulator
MLQRMLDWNDLRYAVTLAEAGTVRAAARRLGVDPSTVSRRLAALEETLGVTLYLKSVRGYAPTAAGQRLLDSLGGAVHELEAFERGGLARADEGVAGSVRVATTEVTAQHLLERSVPVLRERHPGLTVELITGNAPADLTRGEADLAVRFLRPKGVEVIARALGEVRYGLYASAAYLARRPAPTAAGKLAGHDVILPTRELRGGPEETWLSAHARGTRVTVQSNSMPTIAAAAASGLGLAVLPTVMGEADRRLTPLWALDDIAPRPVWLLYHRDARETARVRAAAAAITADLRERLARAGGAAP